LTYNNDTSFHISILTIHVQESSNADASSISTDGSRAVAPDRSFIDASGSARDRYCFADSGASTARGRCSVEFRQNGTDCI
jgi:hypothetical protein